MSRTILQEKQPGLLAERADFRNKAWNTQGDLETQKIRKQYKQLKEKLGFSGGLDGESIHLQCWSPEYDPWEDPLENSMATHSSLLAWRVPWTEEPSSPQRHKEI